MTEQLAIDVDGEQLNRVLAIVERHPDAFHREFADWLRENFDLWLRFEQEAIRARRRGFAHYSARTIVHFLRHETAMSQKSGGFKMNNNVSPDLARLFALLRPSAADFFEFRTMKNRTTPLGVCAA